jgi:hypothetical protein
MLKRLDAVVARVMNFLFSGNGPLIMLWILAITAACFALYSWSRLRGWTVPVP